MTVTALLRSAAIATAIVGVIDPSWTARRRTPVAVELTSPATTDGEVVDYDVRIVDHDDHDLPRRTEGEILARGPGMIE